MQPRSWRLAVNTVATYTRMGVAAAALLITTPIVLADIGPDRYALWTFVFAILGFVGLIELGFGQAVVRFHGLARAGSDGSAVRRAFSTLLAVHVALAALAMLIVALVAAAVPAIIDLPASQISEARFVLWVLAIRSLGLGLPLGVFRQLLVAEHRADLVNLVQIPTTILQAVLTWLAIERGFGLPGLALASLAAMVVEHAAYVVLARRMVPDVHPSLRDLDLPLARRALVFSANGFVVNISALVLLRTDPLIVQFMLPLASVATYGLAMKIAEQGLMVVKQFVNLLSPLVALESGRGRADQVRRIFIRGTRFAMAPAVLLAVLGVDFGSQALELWVGPAFAAGGPVLAVLLVAMALLVPQLVASNVLTMSGRPAATAQGAFASMLVNVAASVILVPVLGLVGVAVGTLIAVVTVDLGVTVTRACAHAGLRLRVFVAQAVLPAALAGAAQLLVNRVSIGAGPTDSWLLLLAHAAPGVLTFVAVAAFTVLETADRARLMALLPGLPRLEENLTRG